MKRIEGVLPHVLVALTMTLLNMTSFSLSALQTLSLGGALLMGLMVYRERRQGDISPVSRGYLLYFVVNAAACWVLPARLGAASASANPAGLLYGCLAAITVFPALVAGRYFTEYFARRTAPPVVWGTDIFRRINRNMTWMWAGIFAVCGAVTLMPGVFSLQRGLLTVLASQMVLPLLLMRFVGMTLNKRYPGYYQRKMGIVPVISDAQGTGGRPVQTIKPKEEKEEVMSNRLKVVAINGSPHVAIGNTSLMLRMMEPVLSKEGIDLEEIFLADKHIEYCVGCAVCLEKSSCWRQDDHAGIIEKVLEADGVILASPVYYRHVTAQMKTFIDRSVAYGHKPRGAWKPGMAVSVSGGMGETMVAEYLGGMLRTYGAFSIGSLTAIAVAPGAFMGMELVEARAKDLASDLARAIKEKRRYPATENDLFFYLFMRDLVEREKAFMRDDYEHWQEKGFFEGFGAYIGQGFSVPPANDQMRKEWLRTMIAAEVGKAKAKAGEATDRPAGPKSAATCRELLLMMPLGFKKEAAGALKAVYQFEISGSESFTAHLIIADGRCTCVDGPHEKPDVTVKSPADIWLAVSRGEMDGQSAFMTGKYKVEGDLTLLMRLGTLFGS
jgi:multimeric flavodoxin WrbA/putative sterol carrier protein